VAALWWTRRNIRWAFALAIATALLITAGWPSAIIAGGVVGIATIVHVITQKQWARRQWSMFVAAVASGALIASPTVVVAAKWSSLVIRHPRGFVNDTFLTHNLDSIVMSWNPFTQTYINSFAGHAYLFEPLMYIAWFLPIGIWALVRRRDVVNQLRADIVAAVVLLILTTGPSILGPTRWSFRYQPFAAFMVLSVVAIPFHDVLTSRTRLRTFESTWVWIGGLLIAFQVAQRPQLSVIVPTIAVVVVVYFFSRLIASMNTRWLVASLIACAPATAIYMVAIDNQPVTPNDHGVVASRTELQREFAPLENKRVMVIANNIVGSTGVSIHQGRAFTEPVGEGTVTSGMVPDGNVLLAADLNIELINGYSAMPNKRVMNVLHLKSYGWATPETVTALAQTSTSNELPLIDSLGITGLVVQNSAEFDAVPDIVSKGWNQVGGTDAYTMYTRPAPTTPVNTSSVLVTHKQLPYQGVLIVAVVLGLLIALVLAYWTIGKPRYADA
jgi:hypothetical protein